MFKTRWNLTDTREYLGYIPELLQKFINAGQEYPFICDIQAVLNVIIPKPISAEDAEMILLPLIEEESANLHGYFDFINSLSFPTDTDIGPLEHVMACYVFANHKHLALKAISKIKNVGASLFLMRQLRENTGHQIRALICPPDYHFMYEALGESGSIIAIPSLMAERQNSPLYRKTIDRSVRRICHLEGLSVQVAKTLSDPAFWKISWNGTHKDFAALIMCFGMVIYERERLANGEPDLHLMKWNIDVIAIAAAKELKINIAPYDSLIELMRDNFNASILDDYEEFREQDKFNKFGRLIKGKCEAPRSGIIDEDVHDTLLTEYIITRLYFRYNDVLTKSTTGKAVPS